MRHQCWETIRNLIKEYFLIRFGLITLFPVTFTTKSSHAQCVCEGNSESIVNALKGIGMDNSRGRHLIKDILSHSNSFQSISFTHVGRQGNFVAHALVQQVRSSLFSQIWLECVPTDIMFFVLDDFPNS